MEHSPSSVSNSCSVSQKVTSLWNL
jgi:hypothetical protein